MGDETIYRAVYIATGKAFEGGLPPTPNRQATWNMKDFAVPAREWLR